MKILFVITKANFGGAQRYVYDLANASVAQGHTVTVLLGGQGQLADKLEKNKIRTIVLHNLVRDVKILQDVSVFIALIKIFRRERPDIIHLNSSKIGVLGSLAGRVAGVSKIIFTAHGWAFNESRPQWQKSILSFLQWLTVLFSHHTIAVSKSTANDISHFPLIRSKIVIIYNGVASTTTTDRLTARKVLCGTSNNLNSASVQQPGALWFGTAAELHKNKGIDVLIDAMTLVQTAIPLFVIVAGSGEERSRLEAKIKNLGLNNSVFLLGNIPEFSTYLSALDCFILPSRTEALAYALLEAGQAHLPVIASAVGGIPEIITDKVNGVLVPKEKPIALARAIEQYANDRPYRESLGSKLSTTVKENFSLEKMLSDTLALYKR
jgi:glycosyltransferase involved in cell wall biosynthesis